MKLLFVNIAYPYECYEQLWNDSSGLLQSAPNVFEWAIIEGLEKVGVDYTLCCVPGLPAWPRYRHIFTPKGKMSVGSKIKGDYLRYCNLPAVKQISIERSIYQYAKSWCEHNCEDNDLIAITYTPQVDKVAPLVKLKKKFPQLRIASIVTDLAENAFDFKGNKQLLKWVQKIVEIKLEHKLFPAIESVFK